MTSEADKPSVPEEHVEKLPAPSVQKPCIWPPFALLASFWTIYACWRWTEVGYSFGFLGFLLMAGGGAIVTLAFVVWWLLASNFERSERYGAFALAVVGGLGTAVLAHRSLGPFLLLPGIPLVPTIWAATLFASRRCRSVSALPTGRSWQ